MDSVRAVAEQDAFARHCGIQIVDVGPGTARARMRLSPEHLNGLGVAHGAAIFALADLAFAAACNSHGIPALAINVSINYLKSLKEGVLTADAREVSADGRLGAYAVQVSDEAGDVVATFQGLCYRKLLPKTE